MAGGNRLLARDASAPLETKDIFTLGGSSSFLSTFLANSCRRMAPMQRQRMATTIKPKAVK